MLPKPGVFGSPGKSLEVTYLLSRWQSVYRRHDLDTGVDMEHGNLINDVKGKDK
jgi:hypothetical protein